MPKKHKKKSPAVSGHPQLSGIVLKVTVLKPKKPNSANRPVARVKLSNGKEVTCSIPGEQNTLQQNADVMVIGGRRPDLPGVKYRIIRGALGCDGMNQVIRKWGVPRRNSRSKYGTKSK
jgi:small subunit ribosomal protein S12